MNAWVDQRTAPAMDIVIGVPDGGSPLAPWLERFRSRTGMVAEERRLWVVAGSGKGEEPCPPPFLRPPGTGGSILAAALRLAAAQRRGLLVVTGDGFPGDEVAAALAKLQGVDPMIGVVQPRFAHPDGTIFPLTGQRGRPPRRFHRNALACLPVTQLAPEQSAPLLLITPQAALLARVDESLDFAEALRRLLTQLRRLGYRTLVANRIVAEYAGSAADIYPEAPRIEGDSETVWRDQAAHARGWLSDTAGQKFETLLADAFLADGTARILLDCRNLQVGFNGTSQAMLGYLQGLHQLAPAGLAFTVLATPKAARFHDIAARFPGMDAQLADDVTGERRGYLAALLLDQPWQTATLLELHRSAVFTAVTMLDTIAWDILAPGTSQLDAVWHALPRMVDGLAFNSNYSRERFAARFGPLGTAHAVTLHSLDPVETAPPSDSPSGMDEPYMLVFGNSYDHKLVDPTLATLSDAFPYANIVALGGSVAPTPRVRLMKSGMIEQATINALVANAAVLVFPSCYEGFGLPVVHGLAHGRVVVVRRSPLWNEIADHARLPGRLVPFEDEIELVSVVGETWHGRPPEGLTMGGALPDGGAAPRWRDCADRLVDLIREMAASGDGQGWIRREAVIEVCGGSRAS
ncbi:glycosyltransferase [Ancylobacter amanitiformis]|uniref:Glycosyltransferase n=1 Tax=Ancylobacter amanitiformis TaxID=217069 RepID=A0ABU0LVA6_9HYPH|nr:hypothetical protein [Ancylobacter amanitiformis]MDQ0512609.1 hypothetical protein [Ancylobacter amanitiformis]